jgi:hypothetical protein
MSSYDHNASHAGFTPARGSPNVRLIHPDAAPYQSHPKVGATIARNEQVNALFVTVLSLACTAVSIYDLLLLASA